MEFTRKEYNKAKKVLKEANNLLIADKEYEEIEKVQKKVEGGSSLIRIERLLKDIYFMLGEINHQKSNNQNKYIEINILQLVVIIGLLAIMLFR